MVERLRSSGLVAQLRCDQPVDLLLSVGDALLAAPILAIAVPMDHPEATALLTALRARFGEHLLVGAAALSSEPQGMAALGAGAEFLVVNRYNTELQQWADRCGALYLPPAATAAARPALAAMGVPMVTMAATPFLATPVAAATAPPAVLINEVITVETLSACAAAGAAAAVVADLLFPSAEWSMPTMIRTARLLRRLWFAS
jgi:2-keto-3-deoxy-6-phosphogluconate aldolase